MLTLRRMIESVLLEGLLDDLKRRFPGNDETLDALGQRVPKKYLQWAANQVITRGEPQNEVMDALREFDRSLQRMEQKDINRYSSLADLRSALATLGKSKTELTKITKKDADIIYRGDDIIVVHPRSKNASCHYGRGSKWCISATESKNYFNTYASADIVFYFVINRKLSGDDENHKIAIVIPRSSERRLWGETKPHAFTAVDRQLTLAQAAEAIGPEGDKIIQMCLADAPTRPQNPQFEALNTKDEKRMWELAATGEFSEQLLRNRNVPDDLRDKLLENPDDDALYDMIYYGEIAVTPPLMSKLAQKGLKHSLEAALIIGGQGDSVQIPDDVQAMILAGTNDELKYVLARCDGISSETARAMMTAGTRVLQGIAENKTYVRDLHDEIIRTAIETNNLRALIVMFQSVSYSGQRDIMFKIVKAQPNIFKDNIFGVLDSVKDDIFRRVKSNKMSAEEAADLVRNLKIPLSVADLDEELDNMSQLRHLSELERDGLPRFKAFRDALARG